MEKDLMQDIFMLVDGSAIVHRAYHAMPPFTTKEGIPTGAVHGFFAMILKIMQELKPRHIAIAFDRPKPTFRKLLYAGYQSHRPKMESDLSGQFEIIQEILANAKIPVYAVDGYEADDIIGTLAHAAKKIGGISYIITGDRDMLQLVNHEVKVLAPVRGISEVVIFDAEKVREKYGINPEQFIELKALMGDSSDNYPGVSGIGPKTASDLINTYKTVENIYKNLGDIASSKKRVADKLVAGAEQAELGKRLATILTDVPFVYSFSEMEVKNVDPSAFKRGLEKYEFKTLPKRVDEVFSSDGKINGTKKPNQMKLL